MSNPIVDFQTLETAEDLFREIAPATGKLWRANDHISQTRGDWVFRGQANDALTGEPWDLNPTARRGSDPFLSYVIAQVAPRHSTEQEKRAQELAEVLRFADAADMQGFAIPGDSHEVRDPRRIRSRLFHDHPQEFPPAELVGMFALAQHHGVPTRLLDWTSNPLVAAYFAALEVARRRAPGVRPPDTECKYFSVYALSRSVVAACVGLDPALFILTVPTATNANLHAQGGLFSLVQPRTDPGDAPLPPINDVLRQHEARIRGARNPQFEYLFPLLREFRVPVREARTVLMTLFNMGVAAGSVYPGLDGVGRTLKEARFYQWASVADRS